MRKLRRNSAANDALAGFTIVELIVSIGVLSILILACATIVSQGQRLVHASQTMLRSNARAQAFSRNLRDDASSATKHGFLAIVQGPDGNSQLFISAPRLAKTIHGPYRSTAQVIAYGTCDNISGGKMLWRAPWLCDDTIPPGTFPPERFWISGYNSDYSLDFASIQIWPRNDVLSVINLLRGNPQQVPASLDSAPQSLLGVMGYWQLLAPSCAKLRIRWTRGPVAAGGPLAWYGVNDDGTLNAAGDSDVETGGSAGNYRAVFTKDMPHKWPTAIRATFALGDDDVTDERLRAFDVICPVGN